MSKGALAIGAMLALAALVWWLAPARLPETWSEQEAALIASLSLATLSELPADPSNAVADDERAARLGQRLFFDRRLSTNGAISCASCHRPELSFSDGLPVAVGTGVGERHTPSLIGIAFSPWLYWDGRRDSQWAQALAPMETHFEQGAGRTAVVRLLASEQQYRSAYEEIFAALPAADRLPAAASPLGNAVERENWRSLDPELRAAVNRAFANAGKALAAYQRKLLPGRSRFDDYADAVARDRAVLPQEDWLSRDEIAGLGVFIGTGQCINCHNGPLFSNHDFHNTGILPASGQMPSMGRYDGISLARQDPFNCLGEFSDAEPGQCMELRFANDGSELAGAHKTPGLRTASRTAPYMHAGQIATLAEVMQHYNEAPVAMLGHNEAKPLGLAPRQLRQLEAFLGSLEAPVATAQQWLAAP